METTAFFVRDLHETYRTTFIRAVGPAIRIGGCQNEESASLDHLAGAQVNRIPVGHLIEAVSQGACTKLILKMTHALVIHRWYFHDYS